MADQDTKPHYLRLVTDAPRTAKRGHDRRTQLEPFLSHERELLALVLMTSARMRLFAKAIDATRPRYIFDLRVLPVFAGAGMTRKRLFGIMDNAGCKYIDVMGIMGGDECRAVLLHSSAFADCVRSVCGHDLTGPMFFLFQSGEELVWSCSVLPRVLQPAPRRGWNMHVLGMGTSSHDLTFERADRFVESVQSWKVGEVLYVVASPSESTGWLLDDRSRPTDPVNLNRGTSVEVIALQIGQWIDVLVLGGPYKGSKVRLASNTHVAHLVK